MGAAVTIAGAGLQRAATRAVPRAAEANELRRETTLNSEPMVPCLSVR